MVKARVPPKARNAPAVVDVVAFDRGCFEVRAGRACGVLVGLRGATRGVSGVGAAGARVTTKAREAIAVCLRLRGLGGAFIDSTSGALGGNGERVGVFGAGLADVGSMCAECAGRAWIANVFRVV